MPGLAGYQGDLLLVANPVSGQGAVGRHLGEVEELLRELGVAVLVVETEGPGDGREAAAEFREGVILSFGGDGTFNEVLNGADLDRCVLGVIPAGTGNVLAKELGLSHNPRLALQALAQGKVTDYDLAVCNGQRCACVCGAGVDADIVRVVHEQRRRHLTQLHYVPFLIHRALRPRDWKVRVEVDGRCVAPSANVVCVSNSRSYGGPIEVTPAASPTDGLLDVMATRITNVAEILQPGTAALLRGLHASGSALYARGRNIRLSSPLEEVPCQVDGDYCGSLPARIHVEPGRLRLLTPRSFAPRVKGYR